MEANLSAKDLRAFLAVARLKSFNQAAQQIHLSPSALSSLIARVEAQVGAPLLQRSTRSVALTAAGEVFAEHAQRVLDGLHEALHDVQQVLTLRRGRVAIAALPSLAAGVLPRLFQAFAAEHPQVRLSLVDTLSAPAFMLVREGKVDFALTAADPLHEDLLYEPLTADEFVLLHPPGHALAATLGGGHADFLQTLAWPHVSMPRTASVRQYLDAAALQHGVVFQPQYELDHLASIGAMVAAGLGVTALPRLAAALVAHHGLELTEFQQPLRRPIGLVRRRDQPLSPAAERMRQIALQAFAA